MHTAMLNSVKLLMNGVAVRTVEPANKNAGVSWRLVYYSPGTRLIRHRHDISQFSVLLAGQARETTPKGTFESRSMLMEFKPAGFEHANEFGPDGALMLSINFEPNNPTLQEYFDVQEWRLRPGKNVAGEWAYLSRNISEGGRAGADKMQIVTFDLLAAMMQPDTVKGAGKPPHWLQRARDAIIETDASLTQIAKDAGVHRVHLSRSFRSHFGQTITECRQEARLSNALRLIAHVREKAVTASSAAGFADQSHLTREMRRNLGITPGALATLFNPEGYRRSRPQSKFRQSCSHPYRNGTLL